MPTFARLTLVGVVDDDIPFTKSLERTLPLSPDFSLAGIFVTTGCDVLLLHPVDVLIINPEMAGGQGLECIRRIKIAAPDIRILAVSHSEENGDVVEALKAGASGYLLKSEGIGGLIAGIRDMASGWSPMSKRVACKVVGFFNNQVTLPLTDNAILTKRENEILSLLAAGNLYKEISIRLGISMETTKKHIRNSYEKLQVQNKMEAVNKWRALTSGREQMGWEEVVI